MKIPFILQGRERQKKLISASCFYLTRHTPRLSEFTQKLKFLALIADEKYVSFMAKKRQINKWEKDKYEDAGYLLHNKIIRIQCLYKI